MLKLFAAAPPEGLIWLIAIAVAVMVVFFIFIITLSRYYRRCPSNRVLVIYGKAGGGNAAKCIHGGAAFVIPLIQDYSYLSLEPIQIEIPLREFVAWIELERALETATRRVAITRLESQHTQIVVRLRERWL